MCGVLAAVAALSGHAEIVLLVDHIDVPMADHVGDESRECHWEFDGVRLRLAWTRVVSICCVCPEFVVVYAGV